MYKVYLKQAWALMGQNRFFTAVYIIGTGLAISMVMAIAVVYHIRTANIAPEVSRDRMGYVSNVSYEFNGGKGSLNSGCGPRFVKEVLYGDTRESGGHHQRRHHALRGGGHLHPSAG